MSKLSVDQIDAHLTASDKDALTSGDICKIWKVAGPIVQFAEVIVEGFKPEWVPYIQALVTALNEECPLPPPSVV